MYMFLQVKLLVNLSLHFIHQFRVLRLAFTAKQKSFKIALFLKWLSRLKVLLHVFKEFLAQRVIRQSSKLFKEDFALQSLCSITRYIAGIVFV